MRKTNVQKFYKEIPAFRFAPAGMTGELLRYCRIVGVLEYWSNDFSSTPFLKISFEKD
ncbi:hypothetical protein H8E88_01725 [candidate division KSB1 bacterium]|nr:hypothetical protein [candidate division KSB1 bacterium]MBL7094358.1 hypothetical protein [candidate division KSB1 bacterium]